MQIEEVPQEPKNFRGGDKLKKMVYAVDPDGNYTGVPSAGWEAENEAMRQAWDDVDETLGVVESQVRRGGLSPVAYFMHKNLMELSLLAKYVGLWKWQVKRHMKPEIFKKLSAAALQKYATTFNITVEELTKFGK